MNKKLIALVLAFALVFSSFTAAFADTTTAIPVDAQAAKDLGMLVGSGNGVTIEYLGETPTRLQSAIMFLRLKGLEQTALSYTSTNNFADADQVVWAGGKNIMAYLNNNPQLGWAGIGANKFNPNVAIDAASYYKVMLETLGYKQGTDFEWNTVITFAATKGLSKVANATGAYSVNYLATATIEALKATIKGGTKTLAAQLVETGVISEAAAIAAGVYTAVPTVLAVESVKSTNLKETVITFNKIVDEDTAEDASNYMIDDEDIAGTVALNADKKSVTITWTTKLANQTEFDLTISDVLDVAGAELAEVTITFLANDVTLPVAQSVTLVGPNKFEIQFSEPIAVKGNITVSDDDFDFEVATMTVDGDLVTVELSDDELEAGKYNVEISNFADYAALKGLKKTIVLNYAKDTTAPVATITEATQTKVVVEFNKPVYNGDAGDAQALTADFFYHTYTSYMPVYVDAAADNKEFTLYFTEEAAEADGFTVNDVTDRPLAEGNVKFVVVADGDDNITDEWGNEVKNNMIFTVAIAADTTAPIVSKVEVEDQSTILVYFSEDVTAAEGDFTVVDEDGEDVEITGFGYTNTDDEYVAELRFTEALEGKYSVTVEDVVDKALEENEISKVTKNFTVSDETAPNLSKVSVVGVDGEDEDEADYIYVTFPEDMATSGAYSVLDKDNYQIKVGTTYFDLKSDDKIATFGGNDKIKITIDDSTKYTVAADSEDSNVELVIGRVADALGNKTTTFNVAKLVAAEVSPVISAVETVNEKTIEITINKELKSVNKSYIHVYQDANGNNVIDATEKHADLYSIKTWSVNKDGKTVITGVLPAALYLANSADVNLIVVVEGGEFETLTGTEMAESIYTAVADGFAPSVTETDDELDIAKTADNVFTITFDENLNTTLASLYSQDLVVKNADGDVLVAGVDYKTEVDGKVVTVTIIDVDAEEGNYKVYSNSTINYIRDLAGNKANAFTTSVTIEDLVQ